MLKLKTLTLILASTALAGCAQTTPRFDAEFGNATRATFNAQIINPDAGNNPDPVTGLDGRAARDAIDSYQQSFTKPEPTPNVFNIGVGNKSGGQ